MIDYQITLELTRLHDKCAKLKAENEKLKEMVARYVDIAAEAHSGSRGKFISMTEMLANGLVIG